MRVYNPRGAKSPVLSAKAAERRRMRCNLKEGIENVSYCRQDGRYDTWIYE